MGRDQIRMRSTGKVDVEKLAEATTVECGTTCSCTSDCPSRFAERGRKIPLVVMYTTTKGWSVFAPQIIPAGTFLGVYTGEIIPLCSAISQGISTSYQFTNIHQIPGTKQYVVDASRMGNETRYFNHACGDAANLKAVSLLSRGNLLTNNMLFFTKRMISKGEELTFSYRGKDMEEQKSGIRCLIVSMIDNAVRTCSLCCGIIGAAPATPRYGAFNALRIMGMVVMRGVGDVEMVYTGNFSV
ncbi:hypothetical protein Y032_0021g323 [Ancylostoma ceylanicum]|nr:hypothetical protein Y032_0021g323 [Ancylostoma ceylanicum]